MVTVSQAALQRYRVRLRRQRIWYAAAITVLVVAASVIATLVWLSGEIAHTTLRTVAKAPADVALAAAPAASEHVLWSSADHPAMGTPFVGGSVVTYDTHTVRGRNGRTGAQTWSYTRTDRTVCTAMQVGGTTVAVYKLNGNCDEVTALDTGTGKRRWTRTLDMDTHQLNGVPQFAISGNEVMVVSPSAIYAINTLDGYDGWVFAEAGCTVHSAVLGTTGALISQTCAHRDCSELKHCLNGPQLVLRDPTTGENTDSSKNNGNPDIITWAIPNPAGLIPASGDAVISAYTSDGSKLVVFADNDGKVSATLPLASPTGELPSSTDYPLSNGEVLFVGGHTYVVEGPGSIQFSFASAVGPTVTNGETSIAPALTQATLTLPSPTGIVALDPETGKVRATYSLSPAPTATAQVYPYGNGFLVASSTVTMYG